jgi:HAE1 family hydrophobic/amphiphilic exporter-1
MAVAVIGGLVTSTLLSLLFVPVVFGIVDRIRNFLIGGLVRRLEPEGKAEADAAEEGRIAAQ